MSSTSTSNSDDKAPTPVDAEPKQATGKKKKTPKQLTPIMADPDQVIPAEPVAVDQSLQQGGKDAPKPLKKARKPTLMHPKRELSASELIRKTDPATLPSSTRHCAPMPQFVGQERAKQAIDTALSIPTPWHVFASGHNGLGKRTMVLRYLKSHAASNPTPPDWVYVNHFTHARTPQAIKLEPGQAKAFKAAIAALWKSLNTKLAIKFRAESYDAQVDQIRKKIAQQQNDAYQLLTRQAADRGLRLSSDNDRHRFVALDDQDLRQTEPKDSANPVLAKLKRSETPTAQAKPVAESKPANKTTEKNPSAAGLDLKTDKSASAKAKGARASSQAERSSNPFDSHGDQLIMEQKLQALTFALEDLEQEAEDQIAALNGRLALQVIDPLITQIKQQFGANKPLSDYLAAMQEDLAEHIDSIINQSDEEFLPGQFEPTPLRYQVNIMASNVPGSGAPVVFEDMPTHYNLIGHVEQITTMGTVTTDFSLIRPGSLHRANGGFLVLEAGSLLEQPYAWQGLKRALQSRQIKLSSLEQMITLTGSISLEPDTIDLSVTVVLLGEPELYYELLEFEPEFNSVFKIRADFNSVMPRTPQTEAHYVSLIADMVKSHKLLNFNRDAMAALIDEAGREAEHQNQISLHAGQLNQLITEASALAAKAGARWVSLKHIKQTLVSRRYRLDYLRELFWQDLQTGQQLISTQGASVGQINALTVIAYADSEFGMPARLSATAYPGNGEILDVERDVNLAGNLHAKGMLIMSSYLRARFGPKALHSFTGALTFEQNYGQIDGDSATLAEACALISALSNLPITQELAITGSMNQFGEVQPIGGINAKIEGFFATCELQGLTGNQGVIIPKQNVQQLMLSEAVVLAIKSGQFKLLVIDHVDQALELLLGKPAGQLSKKGNYTKGTVFGRVNRRLLEWSQLHDLPESTDKAAEKKSR